MESNTLEERGHVARPGQPDENKKEEPKTTNIATEKSPRKTKKKVDTNTSSSSGDKKDSRAERKAKWEEDMAAKRRAQGLPDNATPEDQDARFRNSSPDSAILKKLRDAGDPRGLALPAHGFDEYERADSDAQKKKADEESAGNHRFFSGQRGWVNNPGEPDHGRAVGILRVSEFQSEMDEVLDNVQGGRGKAKTYECESRDGRAEKLFISAEHFRPCFNEAEWGKTPIMTPLPD